MPGLKVVFGGAGIGSDRYATQEAFDALAKTLKDGNCSIIDTAALYGPSEEAMHRFGAPKQFTIDSKAAGGFVEGHAERDFVIKEGEQSNQYLGKLDIYYLHSPSYTVPLESTLEGINEVYKRGYFKRFGLSNFKPDMVQKVYDICKEKGYPLPTAYQGNYNAVARLYESDLIPLLRKLDMAFYAYSPIAGGFLTKTKQDVADGKGRFEKGTFLGDMYLGLYARPTLLESLEEWEAIAKDEGVSKAELAYRWVNYHSVLKPEYGDAVIFGARTLEQAKETLQSLQNGPLKDSSVKRIDAIWEKIAHEAPLDNLHK